MNDDTDIPEAIEKDKTPVIKPMTGISQEPNNVFLPKRPLTHAQFNGKKENLNVFQMKKLLRRAVRRDKRATIIRPIRIRSDNGIIHQAEWKVANPAHPVIAAIAAEAERRNLLGAPRRVRDNDKNNDKNNDKKGN